MRASVVACCDASPILELCEHIFHLVALLVGLCTVRDLLLAVFLGWDAGGHALLRQQFSDLVAVVASIRDQGCRTGQVGQKHIRALEIAALAGCQVQPDRATFAIAHGVQLRIHTALGAPDQAWPPLFAKLEAVRWAFKWVASIINTSWAGADGLASSSKIRAKIPFSDQRTKRL